MRFQEQFSFNVNLIFYVNMFTKHITQTIIIYLQVPNKYIEVECLTNII